MIIHKNDHSWFQLYFSFIFKSAQMLVVTQCVDSCLLNNSQQIHDRNTKCILCGSGVSTFPVKHINEGS